MIRALRARLAARDGEDGYVIVVVVVMLMIALTLGAVGLAESLASRSTSSRDARERRAQQATDAGIQRILYEQSESNIDNWNLNGGVAGLANVLDCVVPKLNVSLQITGLAAVKVGAGGACPGQSPPGPSSYPDPLGNHAFESSEFIPGATNLLNGTTIGTQNGSSQRELYPKILSVGWDDNGTNKIYARQLAVLAPISPLQAVEGNASVTLGGLSLLGIGLNTLNGDVTSRGDLKVPSVELGLNTTLSNGLLGTLAYGGNVSGGLSVANLKHVSASSIVLRPAPIINLTKPACSVPANCTALGSAYNSTYDTFSMSSGSVTFSPGDYVFCSFNVTGGTVTVQPSSTTGPVRILIRGPNSADCALDKAHGDAQLGNFNDPAGYTNGTLNTGGVVDPSGMQVYVEGDGGYDDATVVQIGPASAGGLLSLGTPLTYGGVIYAPTSKVTVNVPAACVVVCTGGVFAGSVIGNDTSVTALTITQDLDLGNYPLYDGIQVFRPIQFVQCNASVTSLSGNAATDTAGC